MADFLTEMTRLNSQNFLGGLVQVGEANRAIKQNQNLVSLWDEFKLKKKELVPTSQQVDEFYKQNQQDIDESRSPVDPALNLYKSMDRIGGMMNLYHPYIAAFSTLGEEGVRIANTLTKELGDQVALEEQRGNVDFKAQQMKDMRLNHEMNKFKFDKMIEEADRNKQIYEMADYIASNPLFDQIESGNVKTWKTSKHAAFTAAQNAIFQDTYKQFGLEWATDEGKRNHGTVLAAFNMAMNMAGKSFTFDEADPHYTKPPDPLISPMDIHNASSFLQTATAEWENMSNEMRNDTKKLMRGEAAPELKEKYSKQELDLLERMAETFRSGGLYNKNFMLMKMVDPTFGKVKKDYLTYTDKEGKEQKTSQMYTAPVNSAYSDIMIPSSLSGFEDGLYEYMPYNIRKQKKLLQGQIEDLSKGSLLEEREYTAYEAMRKLNQIGGMGTGLKDIARKSAIESGNYEALIKKAH
jgi:hypothetical protein